MNYLSLLEQLGPAPTFAQAGEFLGQPHQRLYTLVRRGELETIQTSGRKRICINSLASYLQKQDRDRIPACGSVASDIEELERLGSK